MLWNTRALCADGAIVSATVQAGSEEDAWAQVRGLARVTGRESLNEYADLVPEPALFDE